MPEDRIDVTLNGEDVSLVPGTTVADLVAERVASPRGVAVARNLEMVPRSMWEQTTIDPGDVVEILATAQGG